MPVIRNIVGTVLAFIFAALAIALAFSGIVVKAYMYHTVYCWFWPC